jgi:site-specific recombinase XerD
MKEFAITFYVKKDKETNEGNAPIFGRIRANGTETTFATGFVIAPARWKETKQLKKTRQEPEVEIKNELGGIHNKIKENFIQREKDGMAITAEELKDQFFNPDKAKPKNQLTLLDAFKNHKERFESMVKAGDRSNATLSKFDTTKTHVINFMKHKYGIKDILLAGLNFAFIDGFHQYLRGVKKLSHNYVVRRCEFLKSVIRLAYDMDWIEKQPFKMYKEKKKEVETVFLNEEELKVLMEKKFDSDRLQIVRDLFIFSCFTGYAPVDAKKLTRAHIIRHVDGKLWIFTHRNKTKIESNVPLLPQAMQIIQRYKEHVQSLEKGTLLPSRSNQKMNKYLKEIRKACEFNKELFYYVARHTFATTVCLANGVSMESLSKMMGHKRIVQTQHYAKVMNKKVGDEMEMLSKKLCVQSGIDENILQ